METFDLDDAPTTQQRALQGLLLALGAPFGWLLVRLAMGHSLAAELQEHTLLYVYLLVGTTIAFASYGYVLGRNERRLLEQNRRLEYRSMTDRLTGLRNSRYFWQRIREACAEARRHDNPVSLLLLDLDHFKQVNDEWGHRTGDDVLATVGRRINETVREADTAARVGGEEFAVLLPGTSADEATEIAERIRQTIADVEFETRGGEVFGLTTSVGVASERGESIDEERLFRTADTGLYRAKDEGRNRVCLADAPTPGETLQEVSSPSR